MKNLYCNREDLTNEASVENFLVLRLLKDLGYKDTQIRLKTSLKKLTVSLGSKQIHYKPDFALMVNRKVRWLIEAKAPTEDIADHIPQCSGYALAINRGHKSDNPVQFFMLTNGHQTRVYEWDREDFILELGFDDFVENGTRFKQLIDLLSMSRFSKPNGNSKPHGPSHVLRRLGIEQLNSDFAWCHQFIYRKDNLSQAAAFMEFVKLIFLKLLSDRDVHNKHPEFATKKEISLPAAEVRFSVAWIEDREEDHPNPIDALQFQSLLHRLESEIQSGTRKRIFSASEKISLTSETIRGVVERLEGADLFGIDADLNGRLFETFLNATMRGKDLGQFFTPRSVVKLATRLGRLRADRDYVDTVMDACCGSGGFLIEALADMWLKVENNSSLSAKERERLKLDIAKNRIIGIDVAKNPALARIARMNMYLHGDGGASIYQCDALDKKVEALPTDSPEIKKEIEQFHDLVSPGEVADVVLTNPPFAKEYARKYERDAAMLDDYEVAHEAKGGARKQKGSLKSSVMFIERYYDLLKPGGRLITVIDDSILGGVSHKWIRHYIRKYFLIRAVISLPGDAFQRSKARVKTSLLILEKRKDSQDEQPSIFMYYCTAVGLDDSPRQRTLPVDSQNRIKAQKEIEEAVQAYEEYLSGSTKSRRWVVDPTNIEDRMDVKFCLMDRCRNPKKWKKKGFELTEIEGWVDIVFPNAASLSDDQNLVRSSDLVEPITQVRVKYDGFAEKGETVLPSESAYTSLYRVQKDDIVISNINAIHGATAVLQEELSGFFVTTEYTVCKAKNGIDPRLVWTVLRSPAARSSLLLGATGIGRSRVKADGVLSLVVPIPPKDIVRSTAESIQKAEELEAEATRLRRNATEVLEDSVDLDSAEDRDIIAAFKPPR